LGRLDSNQKHGKTKDSCMPPYEDPRPKMVEIAYLMYDRYLTNSAGGNLSCRVGDRIYLSPRYLGSKNRWKLTEDMILVYDNNFNILEGDPAKSSREAQMHFGCYGRFPEVNGVIHAHPRFLNVFAATGRQLLPTNQYTEKFGAVEVLPNIPAISKELADAVVATLEPHQPEMSKHGVGLILSWHGVVMTGRTLDDAFDTLERLEWSAQTTLLAEAAGYRMAPVERIAQ
jgi:L-fuculose-phosphate aldolase